MKKVNYICSILLVLAVPLVLGEEVTKVGTTAAGFLNIDVGARANGMGGSFVSMADDATAMYWNPAGIALFSKPQANFTYMRWIADISFNYVGFVLPLQQYGSIGINATFMTTDPMERTTVYSPTGTGEMFDVGSYAFGLSYARALTDRFSIGGNFKVIQENIYHSSANGLAFDVGTLFTTRLNGMRIGMSISNYGTKMQMTGQDMLVQVDVDKSVNGNNPNINAYLDTGKYDLPLMFRVGVSMDVLKGRGDSNLNLSLDALHPNDDVESLNIGAEYWFRNRIAFRGGYHSLFARDSEKGLSFGTGFNVNLLGDIVFTADYAYMDFGKLDNVQMFTLTLGF
ncbi:PorV/PorQ family protein [candidate division KSB1 bacterium]|nr:PorV/PorQ family protein [candidate division KSB1 bacterium]